MTLRHYQIGDRITLLDTKDRKASVNGRVVAYRDLAGPRQKLWVKPDDNSRIVLVMVDLVARRVGEPTGRLCGPPIDLPSADVLARMILERRDPRMPIEIQLNTLATALLQAQRSEEGETP